jgi:hypothetical protein
MGLIGGDNRLARPDGQITSRSWNAAWQPLQRRSRGHSAQRTDRPYPDPGVDVVATLLIGLIGGWWRCRGHARLDRHHPLTPTPGGRRHT